MAFPSTHLAIATVTSLLVTCAFWRWFWQRYAKPPGRVAAAWGGFIALLFAGLPATLVAEGLSTGHIRCIGRRCGDITYSVANTPVAFWLVIALLAVWGLFFFSGALFAAFRVFSPGRVAP